jgi:hypothetical protein
MNPSEARRRLMVIGVLCVLPGRGWAADLPSPAAATFLRFDAVFIPALFLTGNAGKTPDGPARALAATKRLSEKWPTLKPELSAAVPGQRSWLKAVQTTQAHMREADTLAARTQWAQAHEALEKVREVLFETRRALGIDYSLDKLTAYHEVMETLANATRVQRPAFEVDFATARALWRQIEMMSFDPATYGLSEARARQLAQARADESNALSALSQALNTGSDADVLKAAAAIKPPFVRAYVAFGTPL